MRFLFDPCLSGIPNASCGSSTAKKIVTCRARPHRLGTSSTYASRISLFSDLAAYFAFYGVGANKLTGQVDPERLSGVPASQNFFQLLGVQPRLGRLFTVEEYKWSGQKVVLFGHGLWASQFASDPGIAGRRLTLNDEPVTVVGVLPESFDFASVFAPCSHIDLYFPFPLTPKTNRWGNTLAIIGRQGCDSAGSRPVRILRRFARRRRPGRACAAAPAMVQLNQHIADANKHQRSFPQGRSIGDGLQ